MTKKRGGKKQTEERERFEPVSDNNAVCSLEETWCHQGTGIPSVEQTGWGTFLSPSLQFAPFSRSPSLSFSLHLSLSCLSVYVWVCVYVDVGPVEHIIGHLTALLPKSGHMKRPFPGHSFTAVPDEHSWACWRLSEDQSHEEAVCHVRGRYGLVLWLFCSTTQNY